MTSGLEWSRAIGLPLVALASMVSAYVVILYLARLRQHTVTFLKSIAFFEAMIVLVLAALLSLYGQSRNSAFVVDVVSLAVVGLAFFAIAKVIWRRQIQSS